MNPRVNQLAVVLRTWIESGFALRNTAAVGGTPFVGQEWRNPHARRFDAALRMSSVNLLETTLAPAVINYTLHPQAVF